MPDELVNILNPVEINKMAQDILLLNKAGSAVTSLPLQNYLEIAYEALLKDIK